MTENERAAMAEASGIYLLKAREVAAKPRVKWLVENVLPDTGLAAIFGPSGSGKSFVALDMLACIAKGAPWFGQDVEKASVLYVGLEGVGGIPQRVDALLRVKGEIPDNFRFLLTRIDIRNPEQLMPMVDAILATGLENGVICIDTLAQAAPGMEENSSEGMGLVIKACGLISELTGCVVILIHHSGKDATKGMRGHSSLYAAMDGVIAVDQATGTWSTEVPAGKTKDGSGVTKGFSLRVVELETNAKGKMVTSCVVAEADRKPEAKQSTVLGANERIVMDALGAAFRKAGTFAPEGSPKSLPPGRPCLGFEDAISAAQEKLPVEPKRKRERTKAAILKLVEKGALVFESEFLWCK